MSVKPGDLIRINECEFGFPAYWNSAMCKFAGRSVEVFGTFDSCNNIVEVYDEEFDCLCVFMPEDYTKINTDSLITEDDLRGLLAGN